MRLTKFTNYGKIINMVNINFNKKWGKSMGTEKLLVCDALDERDFLRKKIGDSIKGLKVVAAKRAKDDCVNGVKVEEFEKTAKSEYQSVQDLIKRYYKIDMAITQANAETSIELKSGRTMTRAAAIALRRSLSEKNTTDFTGMLLDKLERQYADAAEGVGRFNDKSEKEFENYKMAFISKDYSKRELSDQELEVINNMVKPLYGELVDPIGIDKEIKSLHDDYDKLLKEIDTAIKISNATTYIEI